MKLETNTNASRFSARIRALADAADLVSRDELHGACEAAAPEMREKSPVETGALRDGWRAESTPTGARLVNDAKYAAYQRGLREEAQTTVREQLEKRPPFSQSLQKEVP